MQALFGGGSSSGPDPALAQQRAAAERQAALEKRALAAQQAAEQDAIKRGLRGRASLLSSGGELGFSTSPLGG
jgi:hypothetical protein